MSGWRLLETGQVRAADSMSLYVHYDAGYAAGVGSHLFLYLDSSAVNVESVGLG